MALGAPNENRVTPLLTALPPRDFRAVRFLPQTSPFAPRRPTRYLAPLSLAERRLKKRSGCT